MTCVKVGRVLSSLVSLKEQRKSYCWRGLIILFRLKCPQIWESTKCSVFVCCSLLHSRVETRSWREDSSHPMVPWGLTSSVSFMSFASVHSDSDCPEKQEEHKESLCPQITCEMLFQELYLLKLLQAPSGLKIGKKPFRNEWWYENPRARTFRVSAAWSTVQTLNPDTRCKLELTVLLRKTLFCSDW